MRSKPLKAVRFYLWVTKIKRGEVIWQSLFYHRQEGSTPLTYTNKYNMKKKNSKNCKKVVVYYLPATTNNRGILALASN